MEMSNVRNMLKAYILIGMDSDYRNPIQTLKNDILGYEALLETLGTHYTDDPVIQKSIIHSKSAWTHVENALQTALENADIEKMKQVTVFIHGNIRSVIKELAFMKKHLLEKSSIKDKEALDASIEIAASARRLSAHYMMSMWDIQDPTIEEHWEKGMEKYAKGLEVLKDSSYVKDPKFMGLLKSCQKYHIYFTKMWKKPKKFAALIDKKTNIVFKDAKEMTKLILESAE